MRDLLTRARAVHDEGVLAHQAGSHDLWQEKLSEARALLSEIETVWKEQVTAVMPGRDDAEQEEVANEHFGEVWNDIYELKAMVRKSSTLH